MLLAGEARQKIEKKGEGGPGFARQTKRNREQKRKKRRERSGQRPHIKKIPLSFRKKKAVQRKPIFLWPKTMGKAAAKIAVI